MVTLITITAFAGLFTDAGYLVILTEKVKNYFASTFSGEWFCTLHSQLYQTYQRL